MEYEYKYSDWIKYETFEIYNQYNIYILFNFSYLIKVNVNYQVD